jgi:hypothetical protein
MTEHSTPVPESAIWHPEKEAHRGFSIDMLPERPTPLPAKEAFATLNEFTDTIANKYHNHDGVRLLAPDEVPAEGETVMDMDVHITLYKKEVDSAIEQGLVPADFNGMYRIPPEKAHIFDAAFSSKKEEATLKGVESAAHRRWQRGNWERLPNGLIERQDVLSQIIRFESHGKSVDLYNFTATQLSAEHIGKVANAFREMCDRTGGAIMDMTEALSVLPNDDPYLSPVNEQGRHISAAYGRAEKGTLALAEGLFNPDASFPDTLPRGDEYKIEDDVPFHVEFDPIESTTYHELTHLVTSAGRREETEVSDAYADAVGWEYDGKDIKKYGDVLHPVGYGRRNHLEDISVTSEAEFAGGEWYKQLDPARKMAIAAVWASRRSQVEGPSFVRAAEQPLPTYPEKIGQPEVPPLALKFNYIYSVIDPDDPIFKFDWDEPAAA